MSFEFIDPPQKNAVIKVVGVGGGGCNAIEQMVRQHINGVEFIAVNTDHQALVHSKAHQTLQIGSTLTKGLGAGANPEVGRKAANEDQEEIIKMLAGSDLVFITAGMGGGTGTGAAPVIAEAARSIGALTVAVVTKPFPFEGRKRNEIALKGIEQLRAHVDSLITIPNEKLLSVLGKNVTLLDAFTTANNVLFGAVQGIAELITKPGLINVDFADVRTVMAEMGHAMMGSGTGKGQHRARQAAEAAISSPLLDTSTSFDLNGAKGVLVNITASADLAIAEFEEIGEAIRAFTSEDATVIVGTVIDPSLEDELRVTLVATGLGQNEVCQQHQEASQTQQASVQTLSQPIKKTTQLDQPMDYFDIPTFLRKRNQ